MTITTTPTDPTPAASHTDTTRCDPHIRSTEQLPRWQHGRVAWFNTEKGFGFLTPEAGPAVFADYQVIDVSGFKILVAGQQVVFTAADTARGPEATCVVPYIRTSTSTPPQPRHSRARA